MLRSVQDVAYPSAQVYPVNNTGSAFQTIPILEGIDATVLDDRNFPAPGVPLGTLYVDDFFTTGTQGDAFYAPSNQQGQQVPFLSYGILTSVPTQPQGYSAAQLLASTGSSATSGLSYGTPTEVRIRQKGTCLALCVTPTAGGAIAPGTYLQADGQGNLEPLQPPSAAPTPTVTPFGTTGAATWTYKIAAVGYNGVATVLGTAGSTATGNATLTPANGNLITWTPVADAAYYIVVRTVSGGTPASLGVIGIVTNGESELEDVGQAATENTSATVYFPTLTAPSAPTVAQVAGATAGTASNTYTVYAIGPNGIWSAASTGTALATSAAVLSPTQGNKITGTNVTGAIRYAVFRTAAGGTPSSTGFIGFTNSLTTGLVDYGQAANALVVAQSVPNPTTAPGVVLAIAKGTLVISTTTPTLTLVQIGTGF